MRYPYSLFIDHPEMERWIQAIDDLCTNFLDAELSDLQDYITESSLDIEAAYDEGMSPRHYFLWLLCAMKDEEGADVVNARVARNAKYGDRSIGGEL
jgi:hypothetical protein